MKDKQYKDKSKKRLKDYCETRIKTTMIGALDVLEKNLKDLWEDGDIELRNRFDIIRQLILDNGNRQIRLLDKEFTEYDIELLRYHITLMRKD